MNPMQVPRNWEREHSRFQGLESCKGDIVLSRCYDDMAYTDFTLESAEATLGVTSRPGDLFPGLASAPVPGLAGGSVGQGMRLALVSEKARSEFIVAPILLAVREAAGSRRSGAARGGRVAAWVAAPRRLAGQSAKII